MTSIRRIANLVALTVLAGSLACSGTPAPTPTPAAPVATESPDQPHLGKVPLGKLDQGAVVGQVRVTPKSVRREADGNPKPKEGDELVVVDVELENIGAAQASVALNGYTLVDDQGRRYQPVSTSGQATGTLGSRAKQSGQVTFEVPKDAKGLRLVYTGGLRWESWQLES